VQAIVPTFDLQLKCVHYTLQNGGATDSGCDEHSALKDKVEQSPVEWATKNAQNHTAMS
jgi:hypothetical protein